MVKLVIENTMKSDIKIDLQSPGTLTPDFLQENNPYSAVLIDTSSRDTSFLLALIPLSQKYGVPIILLNGGQDHTDVVSELIKDLYRGSVISTAPIDNEQEKIPINRNVIFDLKNHIIINRDVEISLPNIEYRLLKTLCERSPDYLSTEELLDVVWGEDKFVNVDTVYVHIRRLRKKIEANPGNPKNLINQKGVGYRIHSLFDPGEYSMYDLEKSVAVNGLN